MKVTVKLFASLREATSLDQTTVDVEPGSTVSQLWGAFMEKYPPLKPLSRSTGMAVNGRYANPDAPLADGDVVAFLPPVSGG